MKIIQSIALAVPVLAAVSTTVLAQQSWTEVPPNSQLAPSVAAPQTAPSPQGGLTFFIDRTNFLSAGIVVSTETFPSSLIAPNEICTDFTPLSSVTIPDLCFASGDLASGWELGMTPVDDDYALLTTGFFGVPFNVIGPNTFTDNMTLSFSPAVDALGFDLVGDLVGPVTVDINIYDAADNLLGTTQTTGTAAGTFFGVISSTPIGRIETIDAADGGELIGNMTLGQRLEPVIAVPTMGRLGLVLLSLILAGFAIATIRR